MRPSPARRGLVGLAVAGLGVAGLAAPAAAAPVRSTFSESACFVEPEDGSRECFEFTGSFKVIRKSAGTFTVQSTETFTTTVFDASGNLVRSVTSTDTSKFRVREGVEQQFKGDQTQVASNGCTTTSRILVVKGEVKINEFDVDCQPVE